MRKTNHCASQASIEDFRERVAQSLGLSRDVLLNLMDALAVGRRPASSVEVVLSQVWGYEWSSLYSALRRAGADLEPDRHGQYAHDRSHRQIIENHSLGIEGERQRAERTRAVRARRLFLSEQIRIRSRQPCDLQSDETEQRESGRFRAREKRRVLAP